jgi:hypothetical protein
VARLWPLRTSRPCVRSCRWRTTRSGRSAARQARRSPFTPGLGRGAGHGSTPRRRFGMRGRDGGALVGRHLGSENGRPGEGGDYQLWWVAPVWATRTAARCSTVRSRPGRESHKPRGARRAGWALRGRLERHACSADPRSGWGQCSTESWGRSRWRMAFVCWTWAGLNSGPASLQAYISNLRRELEPDRAAAQPGARAARRRHASPLGGNYRGLRMAATSPREDPPTSDCAKLPA